MIKVIAKLENGEEIVLSVKANTKEEAINKLKLITFSDVGVQFSAY